MPSSNQEGCHEARPRRRQVAPPRDQADDAELALYRGGRATIVMTTACCILEEMRFSFFFISRILLQACTIIYRFLISYFVIQQNQSRFELSCIYSHSLFVIVINDRQTNDEQNCRVLDHGHPEFLEPHFEIRHGALGGFALLRP